MVHCMHYLALWQREDVAPGMAQASLLDRVRSHLPCLPRRTSIHGPKKTGAEAPV